jgi:hypothetical protein
VTVLLAVYTKDICHFRFLSVLKGHLFIVGFFHWRALLFLVKGVERALEFSNALGDEVQITEGGFYG